MTLASSRPYHEVFRGSPQPLKAGINAATVPQVLIIWLFCHGQNKCPLHATLHFTPGKLKYLHDLRLLGRELSP